MGKKLGFWKLGFQKWQTNPKSPFLLLVEKQWNAGCMVGSLMPPSSTRESIQNPTMAPIDCILATTSLQFLGLGSLRNFPFLPYGRIQRDECWVLWTPTDVHQALGKLEERPSEVPRALSQGRMWEHFHMFQPRPSPPHSWCPGEKCVLLLRYFTKWDSVA